MCGIAGLVRFDPGARAEAALMAAMSETLVHRGPDDAGMWIRGNVGLAHRRLAIVDREGGRQPLASEDGNVVVVFNGEIYNHVALRAGLAARGHRLSTRSDTEAIVHGYEERGTGCVTDLRGMFAFAVWDQRERRLLLARDRLGIKPLYYALRPGFLAFASEIKALLVLPGVAAEVDPEALDLYVALRYVPGPRTMFRGVSKLPPGHVMVWDGGGLRIRPYWDLPPPGTFEGTAGEAALLLREALEESIRLHLSSEVPLGLFLSGGIDSTSVLAVMRELSPGARPRSYVIGHDGAPALDGGGSELECARLAAQGLGSDHHELQLDPGGFRDALAEAAWHMDEPVADPAAVPLLLLSRVARSEITVVLSGEGADEILGGYAIYGRMLALERARRFLPDALGAGVRALGPLLPGARLRHLAAVSPLPLAERYRGVCRGFRPEAGARLLGRGDTARTDASLRQVFAPLFDRVRERSPLDRMLYVDTKTWLPDDLLVKADKMTMASSQELRVPFLDHRLVELATSFPPELKVRGGTGKALLRDVMAGRIPDAILRRPKVGFAVPTGSLLRRLGSYARDLLLAKDAAARLWFDAAVVERLLRDHERGAASLDQEIFSLLSFELWHGLFVDHRFSARRPASAGDARGRPAC